MTSLAKLPPVTRRLLDARGAAAYLGISHAKFKQIVHDGHVPKVKIDAAVRYDIKDLDDFIERVKAAS